MIRVGLISDTHGLLRPEAIEFLRGSAFIIHAGDIGGAEVLQALAALAPVTAVRGNNDHGEWARRVPATAVLNVQNTRIYVLHDLSQLGPTVAGFRVIVSGHSHRPSVEERGGVMYVNPGSAGPRRFTLPISAAELVVSGSAVEAKLAELICGAGRARRAARRPRG